MRRKAARAAVSVLAILATLPAMGGCSPWLRTGVDESDAQQTANSATAFARMKAARASITRINLSWAAAAPTQPPTTADARDPSWPGYNWSFLDPELRSATQAGLEPLIVVQNAPPWAEGADRPPDAPPTSWKPSPAAFENFAYAAARRYSGSTQPRVQYWQAWNEPNVNRWISPLWTLVGGQWVATGPDLYRGLLNAFYNGVKAADSSNVVLTAGAAPAGLPPGNIVMRPGYFWRRVFCLDDSQPPKPTGSCPGGPARFDVFAHHPYNPTGSPTQSAANPDDVAIPDMGRLTTPLNIAVNAGTVYPKAAKPVWVTEVAWESNPPDPNRISLAAQASYLAGAFYVLFKQGVGEVTWFHLRDEPQGQSWTTSYQSGLYLRGSSIASDFPKPALAAFKFPFTAYRTSGSAVELWGIAPQANQNVAVQRLQGSTWVPVANVTSDDNRMFSKSVNLGNGVVVRAVQSGESSPSWTVGAAYP